MIFNRHSELHGKHAFLSPSKYHWINYTDDKFDDTYRTQLAAARGTRLHALAMEAILLGVKLPRTSSTLDSYVNDAIGYRMTPEQTLFFSPNCFGSVDAICFRKNVLRIHDLKTGVTKASFKQLMVYAALFCLEYDVKPGEIRIELRIYQNDEVSIYEPSAHDIINIMGTIMRFDERINRIRSEELS